MSLTPSATLKKGSTFTPAGGTDVSYVTRGAAGGILTIVDSSAASEEVRKQITASAKVPVKSPSMIGGYSHARVQAMFKQPITLASGEVDINTVSVIFNYNSATTSAQLDELEEKAAQIALDTAFLQLRRQLSLN